MSTKSKTQPPSSEYKNKLYDLYYFHFPFTMLTPTETLLLHGFFLGLTLLTAYGVYAYLPSTIMFSISRAYYYIFGMDMDSLDAF